MIYKRKELDDFQVSSGAPKKKKEKKKPSKEMESECHKLKECVISEN